MSIVYVSVDGVGLPDCCQSRLPSVEVVHLVFCLSTVCIRNRGNLFFMDYTKNSRDTRWRSWLRHCATSRKVAGSIPDIVIGVFHGHDPSGRTMALWLTQPLTEMSTRNISWGQRRPVRRADNLTTFMCRLSWNMGASDSWNPQGLSRPVMGLLYQHLH